jgi:hypothetical protein
VYAASGTTHRRFWIKDLGSPTQPDFTIAPQVMAADALVACSHSYRPTDRVIAEMADVWALILANLAP